MKYEVLLFDADETLLDFDKAEEYAVEKVMGHGKIEYDREYHLDHYREVNKEIWDEFERELITPKELKVERFKRLSKRLGIDLDHEDMSKKYLEFLGETGFLIEGAEGLLNKLKGKYKLVLITNGLSAVQNSRLKNSLLEDYFDEIIISEEVGIAKPNPKIFQYTFEKINHKNKDTALMIGDSLKSDIQGGINFGIDTCWYNPKGKDNNTSLKPTYEIKNLNKVMEILE